MAGLAGDVIQLVVEASYSGQVLNVFYYRLMDTGSDGYLVGLATEFKNAVIPQLRNCTNQGYYLERLVLTNLFNQDDYFVDTSVSGLAGQRTGGEQVAALVAAGIYLQPSNRRVRRGYKFIPAVLEGDMNGNVWTQQYIEALTNLGNAIASDITAGLVDTFRPVIIRRIKDGSKYRLPTSQAELGQNFAYVVGAIPRSEITTMRSRKLGRGS